MLRCCVAGERITWQASLVTTFRNRAVSPTSPDSLSEPRSRLAGLLVSVYAHVVEACIQSLPSLTFKLGNMTVAAVPSQALGGPPGPRPLRLAIYNQVSYHLHVVAGAMRVLQPLSSAPVTVFLTNKVLKHNQYGFMDWLGGQQGFIWKELEEYAGEQYDFVWFISPEFDLDSISSVSQHTQPALQLFYIHNGHMPEADFNQLKALSPDLPLVGMAPHVASYVTGRLQQGQQQQHEQQSEPQLEQVQVQQQEQVQVQQQEQAQAQQQQEQAQEQGQHPAGDTAEWLLPTWPFEPQQPCRQGDVSGLRGFSITGSLDKPLRNYSKVWEQIRNYREQQGATALSHFKLNILGDILGDFEVPDDLQEYVQLYKTPPDPEFYDVIYHSYGIVPALANPAYYTCKLTSAVITTLMTGVPVLADQAFLQAYSLLSPGTVFTQAADEDELSAMFRVAQLPADTIWRTRTALQQLQGELNGRCVSLLLGWLTERGLHPDAESAVVKQGL